MHSTKEAAIAKQPLFADCGHRQIEWLARVADAVAIPAGTTIAWRGTRMREFIVVLDGALVSRGPKGKVLLRPSTYLGGGLAEDRAHDATVTTQRDSTLLVFETRAYLGMLMEIPNTADKVRRAVATVAPGHTLRAAS